MKKHFKKYKKAYLSGLILGFLLIVGGLFLSWNDLQFRRYCKDKEVCACARQQLSSRNKRTFVKMAGYLKKNNQSQVDAGILKEVSADEMADLGLKMKQCTADIIRQGMLNNIQNSQDKFPGDYNCMRQVLMHELSNEEILFLDSPQSKSAEALKEPIIRQMYVATSSKLMKCMNPDVQKQYQEELKELEKAQSKKSKGKK